MSFKIGSVVRNILNGKLGIVDALGENLLSMQTADGEAIVVGKEHAELIEPGTGIRMLGGLHGGRSGTIVEVISRNQVVVKLDGLDKPWRTALEFIRILDGQSQDNPNILFKRRKSNGR